MAERRRIDAARRERPIKRRRPGTDPIRVSPNRGGGRRREWPALGAALAVAALAHAGALGAALVWDDHHLLGPDGAVARAASPADLFAAGFWDGTSVSVGAEYYRPLTLTTFWLERALGGGARLHHATNVVLHLLVCGLVFACARRLGARPAAAALGAALFGTVTRLTEAVTFVSGRTDLLAAVGAVGALALWSGREPLAGRRWAAAALLVSALLAKEIALAGAIAIAALEWARFRREDGSAERLARSLLPVAAAVGLALSLRLAAQVPASASLAAPLDERLGFALQALGTYAAMLATPWDAQLVIGSVGWSGLLHTALGALAAVALTAGVVQLLRGALHPRHAGWLALALAALLPVLHLIPISLRSVAADRYLYVPLAAAAIGLAQVLPPLETARGRRIAFALASLVAVLAGSTFLRTREWRDERRLWALEAARAHPANGQAHFELATRVAWRGDPARALALYDEALRRENRLRTRWPRWRPPHDLLANRALVLTEVGRFEEAIGVLGALASARPDDAEIHLYLGTALSRAFRFAEADAVLTRTLELRPGHAPAAGARQRNARAAALLTELPPEQPGEAAELRMRRAQAHQLVGRLDEAAAHWTEVARAPDADAETLDAAARALERHRQVFGETPATRALARALAARRG